MLLFKKKLTQLLIIIGFILYYSIVGKYLNLCEQIIKKFNQKIEKNLKIKTY